MDLVRKLFSRRRPGNGSTAKPLKPSINGRYQKTLKSVLRWFSPRNRRATVDEAKLQAIHTTLLERYKGKNQQGSVAASKSFIVHRDLEEAITRESIDELFKHCRWFKKELVDTCRYRFVCVIATLIQCGWDDWDNFGSIFLEHSNQRSDENIPIPADTLKQFLSGPVAQNFDTWQYVHKPYIFVEGKYTGPDSKPLQLQENIRLPIIDTSPMVHNRTHGDPSEVKGIKFVRIDHSSLQSKGPSRRPPLPSSKSNLNTKPLDLVLKEISDGAAFVREWEFYKQRHSSSDAICFPLTIFKRGDSGFLLMPRADCDLFQFLTADSDVVNFEVMAEHSTPYAVLLQLQHVAEAIGSIHQQGQRHCDLKPENILIFFTAKHDVISGVGSWKMTDMGLSQEAPRSRNPNVREFSSFPACRGTGAFQAPETHENTKQSVNENTDMWSLGCIICVCLAFIIGGWREVDQFATIRQQSSISESVGISQDWFWAWSNSGKEIVVKSHVLTWLDDLPARWNEVSGSSDGDWLQKLALLVKDLLNVERDKRPNAKVTVERIKEAIELTKGLERPWKVDIKLPPPSLIKIDSTTKANISKADLSRVGKRVSFSDTAQSFPNLLPPGLPLRRKCFPGDRKVVESRISAGGKIATFISPVEAFFYNVQHLVHSNNQDHPVELKIRSTDEHDDFPFTPQAPDAHFRTVRIALPFVALLSESSNPPKKIFVDLLKYSNEHTRFDVIDHITDKSGKQLDVCDLEKVQLSREGTLAFLVGNLLHLHRPFAAPERKDASVALPRGSDLIRYTPRQCAFSQDGSQLSIWVVGEHLRSSKRSHYWRTYDISDPDTKHLHDNFKQATLPPPAAESSSSRASDAVLDATITRSYLYEPFSQQSVYLACDENGQLWLPSNRGPMLLKAGENHPIIDRAYRATTHLPRLMLVLARPAATMADANPEIHLIQGELPPPDPVAAAKSQPKLEVIRGWSTLLNKDHSARCGFASFATGANLNNVGFVASYLDGTLEFYAPREKESRPVRRTQSAMRRPADRKGRATVGDVHEAEPSSLG